AAFWPRRTIAASSDPERVPFSANAGILRRTATRTNFNSVSKICLLCVLPHAHRKQLLTSLRLPSTNIEISAVRISDSLDRFIHLLLDWNFLLFRSLASRVRPYIAK